VPAARWLDAGRRPASDSLQVLATSARAAGPECRRHRRRRMLRRRGLWARTT